MADFKFPADGTADGKEALRQDLVIDFPAQRLGAGSLVSFEIQLRDVTVLDVDVAFKFFSGLSFSGLNAANVLEAIQCVDLVGLTGTLSFLREFINTSHDAFRVILSGTDPSSTATFLINAKSVP